MGQLVRRWQAGWGACRGLRRAEETADALHVKLALPGRHREIIALHADDDPDSIPRLAEAAARAGEATWLTVPTQDPDTVEANLSHAGMELVQGPETLMSIDLRRHPEHLPQPPYTAGVNADIAPIKAVVTLSGGEVAASGDMAVVGADAVAHNIRTGPKHRRRGLASVVMTALTQRARELGAATGLLVASADGERLYSALGWQSRAVVLSVRPVATQ